MNEGVLLHLAEDGADADRLEELTVFLGEELRELDVEDVSQVLSSPPPEGARAIDALAIGTLLVKVADSAGLRAVISAVGRWVHRGGPATRTVRLEIGGDVLELSGASEADQNRLVSLFVSRHSET